MNRKDALKFAKTVDSLLLANDPRFRNMVVVHGLNDFTTKVLDNSFVVQYGDYYAVFSEHMDTTVYHKYEYAVRYLSEMKIEKVSPVDSGTDSTKVG